MLATDNEYYREKLEIDSDNGKQIGISTVLHSLCRLNSKLLLKYQTTKWSLSFS